MRLAPYLHTMSVAWQNGLVYRASVFLWRIRQLFSSIFALTIWTVVYQTGSTSFEYSQSQMITYIFVASVTQTLIISTVLNGLTSIIYSGDLSNLLVRPFNIILYLASQEFADKLKNFIFVLVESVILFMLFSPELSFPSIGNLAILPLWILAGILINFLISLLFGSIGFWSPDSWGPRFIFYTLINFVSGKLFPLDILPVLIQKLFWLTPLPYLSFAQTQLFLNRISPEQIFGLSLSMISWIIMLAIVTKIIWHKGLKDYSANGR